MAVYVVHYNLFLISRKQLFIKLKTESKVVWKKEEELWLSYREGNFNIDEIGPSPAVWIDRLSCPTIISIISMTV